ncbi:MULTISPECIES: hypothetical protein [Enterobacter]|uniref:hypothetical protein n=1 Tax=Enterobacter TaxID=547 RepID=UPI00289E1877|nr:MULTISPECIES: hypothetical protein [Enterobacter]
MNNVDLLLQQLAIEKAKVAQQKAAKAASQIRHKGYCGLSHATLNVAPVNGHGGAK